MKTTKATKTAKTTKTVTILRLGASVFIRTVTHYHIGRVVALDGDLIQLEDACWVPDTERWMQTLKDG